MQEDQSQFVDSQALLQPPPEEVARLEAKALRSASTHKKRVFIVVGLGLLLMALVVIMIYWLFGAVEPISQVEPTPTPYRPIETTQMDQELLRLQSLIEEANPAEEILPPPSVQMDTQI